MAMPETISPELAADPRGRLAARWHSWREWGLVEPAWRAVFDSRSDSSFFLSPEWVEAWLQVFGPVLEPAAGVFVDAGEVAGVCLLTRARRRLAAVTRLSLNASGESSADTPYLEFNTLLCRAGCEEAVAEAFAERLRDEEWDEFAIDGCCPGRGYEALRKVMGGMDVEVEEDWRPCSYVDLAALRGSGREYESALSGNTRAQLRRKARAFEVHGEVRVHAAESVAEALAYWDRLTELARMRWRGQGRATPFASSRFQAFHRELIRRCFAKGETQLLRVAAGEVLLGFLYCFVHGRKVYLYQTGMQYDGEGARSPGMVAIGQAVRHYLEMGMDDFDFLAGEERYKRSLSTGSRELVWVVYRRRGWKSEALRAWRQLRSRVRRQEGAR